MARKHTMECDVEFARSLFEIQFAMVMGRPVSMRKANGRFILWINSQEGVVQGLNASIGLQGQIPDAVKEGRKVGNLDVDLECVRAGQEGLCLAHPIRSIVRYGGAMTIITTGVDRRR
jgi:hypothetical protein